MKIVIIALFSFFSASLLANQDLTAEQLEAWFESDDLELPTPKIDVNDGELVFLNSPPSKPALHSTNQFIIDEKSLESGWLTVNQCFKNLDAMGESEIVYKNDYLRNLTIKSHENIEQAYVSGPSVQLKNVTRPAKVCVSAEVKNLQTVDDDKYVLMNGPYHRRFMDGYFPFELTMDIRLPENLSFVESHPVQQEGFNIELRDQQVVINTLFEGMLYTELTFQKKQQQNTAN